MDIIQGPGFENIDDEEADALNDLLREEVYREKVLFYNPEKKKVIDDVCMLANHLFKEADLEFDIYTYQHPLTPCDVEIEFDIHNNNVFVSADKTHLLSAILKISDGFFIETNSNGKGIKIAFRVRYAYTEITEEEVII